MRLLNIISELFGFKTKWCKVVDDGIFYSAYKNGNEPIPTSGLKSLRLITFKEHGLLQSYLMFKFDDELTEYAKTDITLSDEDKGFFETVRGVAEIFQIPNEYLESFLSHETKTTYLYLENGIITKIESEHS